MNIYACIALNLKSIYPKKSHSGSAVLRGLGEENRQPEEQVSCCELCNVPVETQTFDCFIHSNEELFVTQLCTII